jgi:hypothetical protein
MLSDCQTFYLSLFMIVLIQLKTSTMARNILSIIAGIISSFVAIIAIESIAHMLNSTHATPGNIEAFRNYVHNEAPESFHLIVLSAFAVGSFAGALVTAYISNKKMVHAMTIGGVLMGIGMYNLVISNYPSWVIVMAIFIFLPAAYLGGLLGRNFSQKKQLSH